ncbi:MAG: 23S rRNA (uracil(1939)-C(5))-methyltransferase RlmD [Patescibacteria group bacterium]
MKIIKMKKRRWQNQFIAELLNNYPKIEPKCKHFRLCGGCSFQDFSYQDQLKVKGEKLRLLVESSKLKVESFKDDTSLMPIFGDQSYQYRTRMDYIVGEKGIGLRRKHRFDEIEYLDECWLIDDEIYQLCKKVYDEGIRLGLQPYNLHDHTGYWRYLSVRINNNGEVMLILVTADDLKQHELLERLLDKFSIFPSRDRTAAGNFQFPMKEELFNRKIISIYHLINKGLADTNFGEVRKYWGQDKLVFNINETKIAIGPNTFFQNNISLFNRLLKKMVDWVDADDNVLDLYCGVGTLSLPMARKVKSVLGVELNEESVEMARENARDNNISNVEFVVGDLDQVSSFPSRDRAAADNFQFSIFKKFSISNDTISKRYNILVVDPPRKGLEKVVDFVRDGGWQKIIYLSCNPLTLVKDLEILMDKFEIKDVSFWDLYPQTPHVETLVLLERNGVVL